MLRHARWQSRRARYRYIRRRLAFWRNYEPDADRYTGEAWYERKPGRWSKWNGVCSCGMCRARKYRQDRQADRWRAYVARGAAWD